MATLVKTGIGDGQTLTPVIITELYDAFTGVKLFDNIVVSSNSKKIQKLAKKFGAEVIFSRPKKLSTNFVPKLSAIKHAVIKSEKYYKKKYDYVVDLDVTAPCRNANDIKKAFKKFQKSKTRLLYL